MIVKNYAKEYIFNYFLYLRATKFSLSYRLSPRLKTKKARNRQRISIKNIIPNQSKLSSRKLFIGIPDKKKKGVRIKSNKPNPLNIEYAIRLTIPNRISPTAEIKVNWARP